jgi:hypothetical protein
MLHRISGQIVACEEQVALVRFKAVSASSPAMRQEYRKLEKHWRQLAKSLGFAAEVSGYLNWRAHRLAPPEQ